ncbi:MULTISPECIES: TolC family outer membrane protein [Sphingosinicellaceae]|uniref:TolC family outer membrane protein n=1 Tax=Sphingosinicellaceae TaxID=2820280 RepID=UPI001C1DD524|nr:MULTISPECIES: TolC family outer membrane protein [Polymorphobacter]QYE35810.1 TolC family outer membrane protein [Polymorphobacter sp. PAMC 29334]UAJ10819.1 TolC family outer membrane protein [Polymorphobacter megasporae]
MTRLTVLAVVAAAVGATGFAGAAAADTLPDALAAAYETNPQLTVQRAIVRQADEGVPQALASGRPTVSASGVAQQSGDNFTSDGGRYYNGALSLNQSLYRGGRTRSATSAAENRILAARARLRAVEDNVLLAVVTAYADVLRYAQVVELNENQVKVLQRELQASRDRFEVGDLTRTDVAQSDARLANAQSNLVVARGQLNTANNAYVRVVGRPPVDLAPLPPLPLLPGTVGQATDLANANNPSLVAARFDEAAARYDVSTIERQRLPTLDAGGGVNYTYTQSGTAGFTTTGTGSTGTGSTGSGSTGTGSTGGSSVVSGNFHAFQQTAGLTLTVPLYQAGLNGSQIRAAQSVRSQYMEQIGFIGRQAVETASNAFVSVATARAVITASESSVKANQLALEGVTQENQVGTRTVLEVLNAEQELVVARVNLAAARRDEYVAGYTLLAAVGEAEADPLAVPGEHYDSTANAKRVRHKWGDYDIDDNPAPLPLPDPVAASKSVAIGPPR